MNINRSGLFWGILLIGAGALALAREFGYIDNSSWAVWVASFAAAALLALVAYALSGWKEWWWLFPAGIFGGLAVTLALSAAHIDNAAIASPLFVGLTLPFAAAYLIDRSRNWWALIPGGIMIFLTFVTLLADSTVRDDWIGTLFLLLIAVSFLAVYLNNRIHVWALIPAYVLAVLALAPVMTSDPRYGPYYGSIFLLAVALPFFIVYFRSPQNWWAIIPAGAVTTLALVATLGITGWIRGAREGVYATALLMAGLAVTFAVIWLRHSMPWAKIVSVILAVVAVVSVFFAASLWPVVIILAGIYLLYIALRPKTA